MFVNHIQKSLFGLSRNQKIVNVQIKLITAQEKQDQFEEKYQLLQVTKRAGQAYGFKPDQKLYFDDKGKMCLYYYKPKIGAYLTQYSKYLIPFFINAYLMKTRYCKFIYNSQNLNNYIVALTNPVMLPIQFCIEIYFLKKLLNQKQKFRKLASEIYLHEDGELLEIVYEQKFWKKLTGESFKQYHHIPRLYYPKEEEHYEKLRGNQFPQKEPETIDEYYQIVKSFLLTKYYRNPKFFMCLRTNAQVFNLPILIHIFNGNIAIIDKNNVQQIEQSALQFALQNPINLSQYKKRFVLQYQNLNKS